MSTTRPSMFARSRSTLAPVSPAERPNGTSPFPTRRASINPPPATRAVASAGVKQPVRDGVLAAPTQVQNVVVLDADEAMVAWPSRMNVIPNAFIRSALFSCNRNRKVKKVFIEKGKEVTRTVNRGETGARAIVSQKGYVITVEGTDELNQFDAQVFQLCCAAARAAGDLGATFAVSFNQWSEIMGMAVNSGSSNDRIRASLFRLYTSYIKVDVENFGVNRLRFLAKFNEDKRLGKNTIYLRVDPDMLPLFTGDATEIDIRRKSRLGTSLAKWLHDFYSTHDGRFDIKIADLFAFSGFDGSMPEFRRILKKAIEELKTCENALFGATTAIVDRKGVEVLHVQKLSHSRLHGRVQPVITDVVVKPPFATAKVLPKPMPVEMPRDVPTTQEEYVPVLRAMPKREPGDDRSEAAREASWRRTRVAL